MSSCPSRPSRTRLEANRRVGAALFVIAFVLRLALVPLLAPIAPYSIAYAALLTLRAVIEWSALVAVIGYAGVYLDRPSRILRYGGDRVYPFYIWHQTSSWSWPTSS